MLRASLLAVAVLLAACGQKGPLYLPSEKPAESHSESKPVESTLPASPASTDESSPEDSTTEEVSAPEALPADATTNTQGS